MMTIQDVLLINKYGQELVNVNPLLDIFNNFNLIQKREYLGELLEFIQQSKPNDSDIEPAIQQSKLKPTYTPCVLLMQGVATYRLERIVNLPEDELQKALKLLMSLFKLAYQRRFIAEKDFGGKWWYYDLSDEDKIKEIENLFSGRL